jgi:diguanylate cyclase
MAERILELGLFRNRRGDDRGLPAVTALFDRVLSLLSDTAIENDGLQTPEFRKRLEGYRNRLKKVNSLEEIGLAAEEALRFCQEHLSRTQVYIQDREGEFGKVIDLLRQALAELAGQTVDFHAQLIASSERFDRLIRIEDIHELKRRISEEIRGLRKAVEQRQKQEAEGFERLSNRINSLQEKLIQTRKEASIDPLTRIANRGCFDETLQAWVRNFDAGVPFVLALFDLDNFKTINDVHGHKIGDRVLQCAGKWLSNDIRANDFVARFGGDEFAILLGNITLVAAESRLTRLVKRIGSAKFEYRSERVTCPVPFSVSCGLAQCGAEDTTETLFRRADEALYEAKRFGKNLVFAKK